MRKERSVTHEMVAQINCLDIVRSLVQYIDVICNLEVMMYGIIKMRERERERERDFLIVFRRQI